MKKCWKLVPILVIAAALAWGLWYARPVDVYGLGIGELEAVNAKVEYAEPGQGSDIVWSTGVTLESDQWRAVLGELEGLRFRRPPGNLIREYRQTGTVKTEAVSPELAHVVFYLWDQTDRSMMLQMGACRPCYTSLHTSPQRNLPMSLSGGEDAAQVLAERLLLMEE